MIDALMLKRTYVPLCVLYQKLFLMQFLRFRFFTVGTVLYELKTEYWIASHMKRRHVRMRHQEKHFINGEWVASTGNETTEVINPATEEVIGTIS